MTTYHEFDHDQINVAPESTRAHFSENNLAEMSATTGITGNTHMLLSGAVSR